MKTLRLATYGVFSLAAIAMVAWSASAAVAAPEATAQAPSSAATLADTMAEAATAFLAALTPDQHASASLSFNHEERLNWQESPGPRLGARLRDLDPEQRDLAMDLLRTGVSDVGYQKVQMLLAREPVLSALQRSEEGRNLRSPDLYYVAIWGTPSTEQTWGWRFEGHHISLNYTVAGGQEVVAAPLFLGAQPADLEFAELEGEALAAAEQIPAALAARVLSSEEDKARALVRSLDAQQRAVAVFVRDDERDADMISGIGTPKAEPITPLGLHGRDMTEEQKALLAALVEEYLSTMPADVAAERTADLLGPNVDEIAFAWVGGTEPGEWHYYTVQGPTFLIEYANARNNLTNHIHTIWRDFEGDFGADLLSDSQ